MGIKHTIQMYLKMQNDASKEITKVENQIKKLGSSSKTSMNGASQSTQKLQDSLAKAGTQLEKVSDNYLKVGTEGKKGFNQLTKEQQKAVVQFNKMSDEAQNCIIAARECGEAIGTIGKGWAINQFKNATIDTKTWAGSLDYAKNKIDLLGTDTESLRGKIQIAGTAVQTYFSTKWDMVKPKITGVASIIRSKLGSAISTVGNRVRRLGESFSGLGGIISSAIGIMGMASISDMTVGLSMGRERMTALTSATMGSTDAGKQFVGVMNDLTNTSLVGLDDLGQAMSTIKMSTGMTNAQLQDFTTTVNDVGQRAILMGKNGEEAVNLMQAAGRGLNGEFDILKSNFGITKDKLKDLGWNGAATDVKGYQEALDKALEAGGSMNGMMNTSVGHIESLKKNFRIAGRHVGDMFTPYIDQAVQYLNKLNDSCPSLFENLVMVAGAVSGFATIAPTIAPMINSIESLNTYAQKGGSTFLKLTGHVLNFSGKGLETLGNKLQNIGPTLSSFKDKFDKLKTYFSDFKDKISNIDFSNFTQRFKDLKNSISGKFSWDTITGGLSTLKSKMLTTPFNFFKGNLIKLKDALKGFKFSDITNSISNFGKSLVGIAGKVKTFSATLIAEGSIKQALAAINIQLAATEGLALAPILLIIGAIIALGVAVYELGKYFGWWKDIPTMLQAVKSGLQRLWSAFINNPDVQDFIKALGDAWNSVTSALGPVIDAVLKFLGINTKSGEEFDIVRVIIDGVGAAFHQVANAVRTAIGVFQTIYGVFQSIYSFLAPYGEAIYNFLKPIVCILLGCSPGIVPALEKVQEIFQTVWGFIAGYIGGVINTIVSIISTVVTTVRSIINVFGLLLSGQISLSQAIPLIWGLISTALSTILGTIIDFVTTWAGNLLSLAISAASNFVNGIINKITELPGSVFRFIRNTGTRIKYGAVSWVNYAKSAAKNTVNGVVNNIQGLPGKVYTEFVNIGSRIKEAFTHVVKKASDFAYGIKNKILNILGIHSPGILQKLIGIEFKNISIKSIGEKARLAYDSAKNYASNIISGFESEDMSSLEMPTPNINANAPSMTLSGVTPALEAPDTSSITDTVTTAYDTMNNLVGVDLANLQSMNTQSFDEISLNEETMMNKIYNHVNTVLLNILKTNKSSLNANVNTTNNQLSKMHSSTKTVTGKMVNAWASMKNSIVAAAKKIDNDATAHFNSLSKTIGGFYVKLQNPSRWGTGPGPQEERRGTGRGVQGSRLVNNGNAMRVMSQRLAGSTARENKMPRTISVKSVQNNPTFKSISDFVSDGSSIDVKTLFETGVLSPTNLGGLSRANFGAWENTAKPNMDKIKKTSRNWSMKGPKIAGRVSSGLTFHVKDFENGTPKISLNDFISMAYALVGSTSYGYYADSSRYGNWLNALNHGVMNCSDGSDMLIALARTCGLPAEKVHCYWGTSSSGIAGTSRGEGHFVARIGGRIMDSVSMRHGSLTSPKVHGYGTGPSPFEGLNNTNNDSRAEYVSPDKVNIDGKLEIVHKFENLPPNVDEAALVRMIKEAPNDERFVKQLANNIKFQIADKRAKVRFERKNNRSKGLGA